MVSMCYTPTHPLHVKFNDYMVSTYADVTSMECQLEFHSRQSRVDKTADCKSLRVGLQENDWVIQ